MKMSDDNIFIYNDVRKFGSIHWSSDIRRHFLIKNIGVEPLTNDLNSQYYNCDHSCINDIFFVSSCDLIIIDKL